MIKSSTQNLENTSKEYVVIFGGAHGSGKDTLEARFTRSHPSASRIVRHITRKPAPNEVDGRDYYFVGEEHFLGMIATDAFIEYAQYVGMMSGTSYAELDDKLECSQYASLSANFRDGLLLHRKLGARGLSSVCFFVSPVSHADLYDSPTAYLEGVRARMLHRGRS